MKRRDPVERGLRDMLYILGVGFLAAALIITFAWSIDPPPPGLNVIVAFCALLSYGNAACAFYALWKDR